MTERNIVVVLARCSDSKTLFGVRFERKDASGWAGTWAFPLRESTATREGYDRTSISGSFSLDPSYPGCPSCRARAFFRCGCGKVGCWDGERRKVTCPWCGMTGELQGIVTSLDAGVDG